MASRLPKVHSTPQGPSRNLACGKLEWIIYHGGVYLSTGEVMEVRREGKTERPPKAQPFGGLSKTWMGLPVGTGPGLRHPEC